MLGYRERSLSGAIGGVGAARCWFCSGLGLVLLGLQGAGATGHPMPWGGGLAAALGRGPAALATCWGCFPPVLPWSHDLALCSEGRDNLSSRLELASPGGPR